MKLRFFLAICCLFALAAPSRAEEGPLDRLAAAALSFFTPVKATVSEAQGGTITADVGSAAGVREGMRVTVLRKGMPFIHPITKERIGVTEEPVGMAEVVEVEEGSSRLALLRGEASPGDILRISSAKVKALYYPSDDIDWNLSEEYLERLKSTGRFELVESPPGTDVIAGAKGLGAEVAIVVSAGGSGEGTVLRQRLLWVEDGREFSDEQVKVEGAYRQDLSAGEELFMPKSAQPISYDMPFGASHIASGDLDGDGTEELVIRTGRDLVFYSIGASLRPALGGAEVEGKGECLWLDVHDLDGDGRAEIAVTEKDGEDIESRLYGLRDGKFKVFWKADVFARVIRGKLYGQARSTLGGYEGGVFEVPWDKGGEARGPALSLPPGVNIYDFNFTAGPGGPIMAYDEDDYLTYYDESGARVWQSGADYGGVDRKFSKYAPTVMVGGGEWSVKDRLLPRGRSALLAVRRTPLANMAKGLGYKNSSLVALVPAGPVVQEVPLVEDIPGKLVDFAVSDNRIYVLARPLFGVEAGKILKGQNPIVEKFYIYTVKGRL
jgi:hypothetical protein